MIAQARVRKRDRIQREREEREERERERKREKREREREEREKREREREEREKRERDIKRRREVRGPDNTRLRVLAKYYLAGTGTDHSQLASDVGVDPNMFGRWFRGDADYCWARDKGLDDNVYTLMGQVISRIRIRVRCILLMLVFLFSFLYSCIHVFMYSCVRVSLCSCVLVFLFNIQYRLWASTVDPQSVLGHTL